MTQKEDPFPPKRKILNDFNENLDDLQKEKSDYEKYQICLQQQINELIQKNEKLLSCLNSHRIIFETLVVNYKTVEKDYQDHVSGESFQKRVKRKLEHIKKHQDPAHPIDIISSMINYTDKKYQHHKTELKSIQNQIAQIDIEKIMNAFDEKENLIKQHLELKKRSSFLYCQFELPQHSQPKNTMVLLHKLIKTMKKCDQRRKRLFALKYSGYADDDFSIPTLSSSSDDDDDEKQLTVIDLIEKYPDVRPSHNLQSLITQEMDRRRRKEAKRRRREEIEKEDEKFIQKTRALSQNKNLSNPSPILPSSPKDTSHKKHRKYHSTIISQIPTVDKNTRTHDIQPPKQPVTQSVSGRQRGKTKKPDQSIEPLANPVNDNEKEKKKNEFSSLTEPSYNVASSPSSAVPNAPINDSQSENSHSSNNKREKMHSSQNKKNKTHKDGSVPENDNSIHHDKKESSQTSNHNESNKSIQDHVSSTKPEADPNNNGISNNGDRNHSNEPSPEINSKNTDDEIEANDDSSETKVAKLKVSSESHHRKNDCEKQTQNVINSTNETIKPDSQPSEHQSKQDNSQANEEKMESQKKESSVAEISENEKRIKNVIHVSSKGNKNTSEEKEFQPSDNETTKHENEVDHHTLNDVEKKESSKFQSSSDKDKKDKESDKSKENVEIQHDKESSAFQSDKETNQPQVQLDSNINISQRKDSSEFTHSSNDIHKIGNDNNENNQQRNDTDTNQLNGIETKNIVNDNNENDDQRTESDEFQLSGTETKNIVNDNNENDDQRKESDEFQLSGTETKMKEKVLVEDNVEQNIKNGKVLSTASGNNENEAQSKTVDQEKKSGEFQPSDNESNEFQEEIIQTISAKKDHQEKDSQNTQLSDNVDKIIPKDTKDTTIIDNDDFEFKSSDIPNLDSHQDEEEKHTAREIEPIIDANDDTNNQEKITSSKTEKVPNIVEVLSDIPDVDTTLNSNEEVITGIKEMDEVQSHIRDTLEKEGKNDEKNNINPNQLSENDDKKQIAITDTNEPKEFQLNHDNQNGLSDSFNKRKESYNMNNQNERIDDNTTLDNQNEMIDDNKNVDNEPQNEGNDEPSIIDKEVSEFKSSDIPGLGSSLSGSEKNVIIVPQKKSTNNEEIIVDNEKRIETEVSEFHSSDIPNLESSIRHDAKENGSNLPHHSSSNNQEEVNQPDTSGKTVNVVEELSEIPDIEISSENNEKGIFTLPDSSIIQNPENLAEIHSSKSHNAEIALNHTENPSNQELVNDKELSTDQPNSEKLNDDQTKETETPNFLPRPPPIQSDKKAKKRRRHHDASHESTEMNVTFDLSNETQIDNNDDEGNVFLLSLSSSYISEIKTVFTNDNQSTVKINSDDQEEESTNINQLLMPMVKPKNDKTIRMPHNVIEQTLNTIEKLQSLPNNDNENGSCVDYSEYDYDDDELVTLKLSISDLYSLESINSKNPRLSSMMNSLKQTKSHNPLHESKSQENLSLLPDLVSVESNAKISNMRIKDKNEQLDLNLTRIENHIGSINSEIEELKKKIIIASRNEIATQSDIQYSMKSLKQIKDEINQNEDSERILNELKLRKEMAEQDLKNQEEQLNQANKLSVRKIASLRRYKQLIGDSEETKQKLQSMTKEERKMYKIDEAIKRGKRTINLIDGKIADLKNIIDMKTKELSCKAKKKRPDVIGLCDELKKDRGNEKGMVTIFELNQIERDYLEREIEQISYQFSDDSLSKKRFENERIQIMAKNYKLKFLKKKGATDKEHHIVLTNENDLKTLGLRIENANTEVRTIVMHTNLIVAQIQKQMSQLQSLNLEVPPPPQSFVSLKSAKKS